MATMSEDGSDVEEASGDEVVELRSKPKAKHSRRFSGESRHPYFVIWVSIRLRAALADINDLIGEDEEEVLNDPEADAEEEEEGSVKSSGDEGVRNDDEELEDELDEELEQEVNEELEEAEDEEDEDEPPRRNRKIADGTPVRVRKQKVVGMSLGLHHRFVRPH